MEKETERMIDLAPRDGLSEFLDVGLAALYEDDYTVIPSWMKEVIDNLAFIKAFLMDPPEQFVEDGRLGKLEYLAREVGTIISSFDLKNMDKDMARKLCAKLSHYPLGFWVYAVESICQKKQKASLIDYPRIGQVCFVDRLVENLEHLVKVKADLIGPLKHVILQVQQKLRFLSSRLTQTPKPPEEIAYEDKADAALQRYLICRLPGKIAHESCLTHDIPLTRISGPSKEIADEKQIITHLANEVDYVIGLFLAGDIPIWDCMFSLRDILELLNERQEDMDTVDTQSMITTILSKDQKELSIIPVFSSTDISDQIMEVFDSYPIVQAFHVRTWSSVLSYKERKKEVLHELLDNVSYLDDNNGLVDKVHAIDTSEAELEKLVQELLKNKRYFIILEDVQDIDAFNDIRRVMPDDRNGSILLLITHPQWLATQCYHGSLEVVSSIESGDHTSTPQIKKSSTNNYVVGFHNETERLLELHTRGPKTLQIISIFAMSGQGKTTLAKKLYNDHSVVEYFDVRAWCCVSQVCKKKELLLELLSQLDQQFDTIHNQSDQDLGEMLYKQLKGRRFLIFLDDIRNIDAWNYLRRCFPNDNNGSRIMVTTTMRDLALRANSNSILLPLSPLSNDESWELLRKKVFGKESCPVELLAVGKEIAKNCKGLPLSIVLTAGLLAKMEKKLDQWEHIAKTLSRHLLSDAGVQGKGIIELSYKHLPNPLKPCFLYFGKFLKGRKIPVSKLIRLWIAEGFIEYTDSKTSKDVAKNYLMDLIGRNLVMYTQEKSDGGVKSCHVHGLLLKFCLTKAKEEKFLQQVSVYNEHFPFSNDIQDYGIDPRDSCLSTRIRFPPLCIHSKRNQFTSHNFKLLIVLDLEHVNIDDSFKVIDVLVLLRYLAVQVSIYSIPSSIANLRNLEFFLVKGLSSKVIKVPNSIWDMEKLRHLHIKDIADFDLDPHNLEKSSILENLQSLSTPSLVYGDNTKKILKRLPGIRELKCIFLDSWDDVRYCNQFPELEFLNQLVSLKVFYDGVGLYPCKLNLPSNLNKLTLSNFRMPWSEISQLVALGNLEVLELLDNAFKGKTWEMADHQVFPKLKFLKLKTLNIVKWTTINDHFPHLERLILHKCKQLKEIPPGMGDIPTLQMIEVMWCNPSVATSAKNIQEKQLEFGNEGLKIHVHPQVWEL